MHLIDRFDQSAPLRSVKGGDQVQIHVAVKVDVDVKVNIKVG
jgi:hypothetical protein